MNLNLFMQGGINRILKTAGHFYLHSPKGRKFLATIVPQMKQSALLREQNKTDNIQIPPFLIASVASQCNLHCAGCYARAGGSCGESSERTDLTASEWSQIFAEASSLGVSFILLAGGEPLMRQDVITAAASYTNIVFPVFTNGTMIDDTYLSMFDSSRNLIPVLSIEGNENDTDMRRGAGTSAKLDHTMTQFKKKNILFGASITVTKTNLHNVTSSTFLSKLHNKGCGIVFYVEYVPVEAGTDHLALDTADQDYLNQTTETLKAQMQDMIILSFPGDEASMGGCLASGRGFFHINPNGGAEPCPFSPYAKHNLKDTSIKEVLQSRYFDDLRAVAVSAGVHTGGCVLFSREKEVQDLLNR